MARDTKIWRCGKYELKFDRPRIMGVLNATPEYFANDEGAFDADAAIAYGLGLLDDGADIVDVHGESTHPGFAADTPDEEAKRVLPVVRALAKAGAVVSVGTRHVDVAKAAVRVGASIVNDLSGFADSRMVDFAKQGSFGLIIMHAGDTSEQPESTRTEVKLDTSAAAYAAERARAAAEAEAEAEAAAAGKGKLLGRAKRSLAQPSLPFGDAPNGSEAGPKAKAARGKAAGEPAGGETKSAGGADASPAPAEAAEVAGSKIELSAAAIVAGDETASASGAGLSSVAARSARRDAAYVSTSQLRRFTLPDSAPIMRRVMGFLSDQARALIRAGVARERICLDPTVGFGGDLNEDIVIQREMGKIASLGYPLLCSTPKRGFASIASGASKAGDGDSAAYGIYLGAIEQGANIVCVSNVAGFVQFLNGFWAIARPQPRRAFVSLESNMGRRLDNLREARDLISQIPMTCVSSCSRIYESEPVGQARQDLYASAVIEIKTELAPLILLGELIHVEDELGRNRTKSARPGGPRVIDCDLLWMDNEVHGGNKLQLPHPGLGERDCALVPLEDLMHNPARFFRYEGVDVKEPEERVGHVVGELGAF